MADHTRLRIEYFDQNSEFARHLPRVGVVEREFRDISGEGSWLLVRLDDPFELQLATAEPLRYRLAHIDAFLLRSRWQGFEIGEVDEVSVFILLVERDQHPEGRVLDPQRFVHIAWGLCRAEA